MKQLFFDLQTDKQFYRQVYIARLLNNSSPKMKTAVLANKIGCTLPTLYLDIKSLNKLLPETIKINYGNKGEVQLVQPKTGDVLAFLLKIAQQTPTFLLISHIFHHRNYPLEQMSQELFVSPSSLRRMLAHVNKILKQFHIAISPQTMDFEGKEQNIRFFLFTFYSDFKDCFIWEENWKNTQLYMNLLKARKKMQRPFLQISSFRLFTWVSIAKERLAHNYVMTLSETFMKEIRKRKSFENFQQLYRSSFSMTFGFEQVPQTEIVWAYVVSLHCVSYAAANSVPQDVQPAPVYRYEEDWDMGPHVNRFLEFFSPKTGEKDLFEKARAYLINMRLLTKITPLFQKVSPQVKEHIELAVPDVYDRWCTHLKEHQHELPYPIAYIKDMAITLSMFHFELLTQSTCSKQPTVIFSFHGEAGYDVFLTLVTKPLVPKHVHALFLSETMITSELIKNNEANLVVCNYHLTGLAEDTCDIIQLSYLPSIAELRFVRNTLTHLLNSIL